LQIGRAEPDFVSLFVRPRRASGWYDRRRDSAAGKRRDAGVLPGTGSHACLCPRRLWFRTGDIAVVHPDGYLEIRDRAKDIIISGGENIASVEVEQVIDSHPSVLESAVVAAPDDHWGEVPIAFVTLAEGKTLDERTLIEFVKKQLARYKAPKRVVFGPLPKTGTGKIMKYELRERLRRPQ